jgi:hypothetical protein
MILKPFCCALADCYFFLKLTHDRLCGLVFWVPDYEPRDSGYDPLRYQIFRKVLDLKRDPLGLVRLTEELFRRNSRSSGLENRD